MPSSAVAEIDRAGDVGADVVAADDVAGRAGAGRCRMPDAVLPEMTLRVAAVVPPIGVVRRSEVDADVVRQRRRAGRVRCR